MWTERLPQDAEDLWPWLQGQEMQSRLDLLAHCAACTVKGEFMPIDTSVPGLPG